LFVEPAVTDGMPKKPMSYRMIPLTLPPAVDAQNPRIKAHIALIEKRGPENKAVPMSPKSLFSFSSSSTKPDPRVARKIIFEEGVASSGSGSSPRLADLRKKKESRTAADSRGGGGRQDPRTHQDPRIQGQNQNMAGQGPNPNMPGQEQFMGPAGNRNMFRGDSMMRPGNTNLMQGPGSLNMVPVNRQGGSMGITRKKIIMGLQQQGEAPMGAQHCPSLLGAPPDRHSLHQRTGDPRQHGGDPRDHFTSSPHSSPGFLLDEDHWRGWHDTRHEDPRDHFMSSPHSSPGLLDKDHRRGWHEDRHEDRHRNRDDRRDVDRHERQHRDFDRHEHNIDRKDYDRDMDRRNWDLDRRNQVVDRRDRDWDVD
jgi:hypothetical protein